MDNDNEKGEMPKTNLFKRIKNPFGAERKRVSEEEIKNLVTINEELLDDEKRMIGEILELDTLDVDDIMTPRVDIIAVEDNETLQQTVERMQGTGYSRLPVYHEDLDQIIGLVHLKDIIFPLLEGDSEDKVANYTYEPIFVPETKDLLPLLSEMQTNRQQMAIVVDEYGGTDGLITVEDIIEEIVGEIIDETDLESSYLVAVSDNEWLVDGRFSVEDASSLGWPVSISDEYETIAGWLMSMLEEVPHVGEKFSIDGYHFTIQRMRRRRIKTIRVKRDSEQKSA